MSETFTYGLVYIASVLISSISQIMLKHAAKKNYSSPIAEYLNPWVCGAYVMFLGSTVLTTLSLRYLNLSTGIVLESSGYIFVFIFSALFLKERISKRKLLGMAVILIGILIFTV